MAIQPIDLQTLFSQLDKVGKAQAEQKEGLQIQQALQGALDQQKTDERIRSVNETQQTGEGAERVKDRTRRREGEHKGSEKRGDGRDEGAEEEADAEVIRDPNLGRNIDVSG